MRRVSNELVRCAYLGLCGALWSARTLHRGSSARPSLRKRAYRKPVSVKQPPSAMLLAAAARSMRPPDGKFQFPRGACVLCLSACLCLTESLESDRTLECKTTIGNCRLAFQKVRLHCKKADDIWQMSPCILKSQTTMVNVGTDIRDCRLTIAKDRRILTNVGRLFEKSA